jgi:flagellar motor switch protein FliN
MSELAPGSRLHSFLDSVRKATSEVLSRVFSTNWSVEIDTAEVVPSGQSSDVCFQLSTSGALQGDACIQLRISDALLLAQTFLAEPVDPAAPLNQPRKEALEGLLRQVASLAAEELKGLFGETKLEVVISEPSTWQAVSVTLRASEAASGKLILELRLSPELVESLSPTGLTPDQVPVGPAETSSALAAHEPNYDLLLGVNLTLTLRFGRRMLPLRDILELNAGSVIELDREVHEPADLLLGDKIIARGQVVIIDGNYGLRITEVADARQRIGTL